MTARVLPFTHKSAAIYDAAVAQAMGDIFGGVRLVSNDAELIDSLPDEDSISVAQASDVYSGMGAKP